MNPVVEQEAREEHQIGETSLRFGSKNKEQATYAKYVLDNQIEFFKESDIDGDKPVYSFREDLLQFIAMHQVIVIAGNTGSKKTTKIPLYLHEAGYTNLGKVVCTQPCSVVAKFAATRVSEKIGGRTYCKVGYSIPFEDHTSERTLIKYMTDEMLVREFIVQPDLASYSVVMVDKAHERALSTDVLLGLLKALVDSRKNLKLLVSSTIFSAEKFSMYFGSAPVYMVPGRRYPIEINYTEAPKEDYIEAAIDSIFNIHLTQPPGDILVFFNGLEEAEAAGEVLKNRSYSRRADIVHCVVHASLPTKLQARAFEPTREGLRKVVLASTNVDELLLATGGIRYVVDPGYVKLKFYNARTGMETLLSVRISKTCAVERALLSGLTGPGKCYRLYTEKEYHSKMEDNTIPEIQRSKIAGVVLTLKCIGVNDFVRFKFMDRPPKAALKKSLEELYSLNALNKFGQLTMTGRVMGEFHVDPMLSKMLVASGKYKCSQEAVTVAAMLLVGDSVFSHPKGKNVHADKAMMKFHTGNVGDHVGLLKVFLSWKDANFSREWCFENYMKVRGMVQVKEIRDWLEGIMRRVGIELCSNENDLETLKKAITSGFFHHSAKLKNYGIYSTLKNSQSLCLHPNSSLTQLLPRCVIFHEVVHKGTKNYMTRITEIDPEWLLQIAPHYYKSEDIEDAAKKQLPRGQGRGPISSV